MSNSIPLGPIPRASQDSHVPTDRDRDHERPPGLDDDLPPNYEPPKEQTQMELHRRSPEALFLALFYAALVLAPWTIICVLADRPITTDHYGGATGYYDGYVRGKDPRTQYRKNERWYHAARTIQVIASVLTLPLISAICARAAVIFMQRQQSLKMPQLMTLADRGWMDLATYGRIYTMQWGHYGSPFLLFALLVSLLGLIISPIQSIFLTSQAVKTPTDLQRVNSLWDILTHVNTTAEFSSKDRNIVTIMTRAALTTATTSETHPQLWPGANASCDPFSREVYDSYKKDPCPRKGATFENISAYPDPFLAPLPANFHTGLLRQFLPRINSTSQIQSISEAEFPANCDTLPGAFFVEYTNTSQFRDTDTMQTWGLKACMPANVTASPWRATHDRHDFVEELFLDVRLDGYNAEGRDRAIHKITLATTSGYFELPNYMNGGVAGFLLDTVSAGLCDDHCEDQNAYIWEAR